MEKSADQPGKVSAQDTAAYVHDLLDSLQKVAQKRRLPLLAHLVGLAKAEAGRSRNP